MKQYIILVSALILVIGLNIFQCSYLKKTSEELLDKLENVKTNLNKKDFEIAFDKIEELEQTWKNKKAGWDIFTEHDDVEEIESNLKSLKTYAKLQDYNESMNEIAILEQRIEHILENESLSFASIF